MKSISDTCAKGFGTTALALVASAGLLVGCERDQGYGDPGARPEPGEEMNEQRNLQPGEEMPRQQQPGQEMPGADEDDVFGNDRVNPEQPEQGAAPNP